MCTAAEAKTLQRVYGRYNSFFRKVIPAKRMQKPVLWYTRLTVYGNPGRVVNGCAPGIPVLICGFGVVVRGGGLQWGLRRGRRSSSFLQGHPPSLRFGHPDVTTDDTAPPHARTKPERGGSYTLRKRHQGTLSGALRSEARRERSAREGGFPCRSGGRV